MSGSEDEGRNQPHASEEVLAFRKVEIQQKRFYLDVKQNNRGRFIKIAEFSPAGRKNRILLAIPIAHHFRDQLTDFNNLYVKLGPQNPDNPPEDGRIKSAVLVGETRRYYMDLKENDRGRFVRVSQTIRNNRTRSQIGIPAQGMIEFRDALTELLEEFGNMDESELKNEKNGVQRFSNSPNPTNHTDYNSSNSFNGVNDKDLPEGINFRIENKRFFFDIRQNNNGIYMRISEVKNNFRAAITIPDSAWSKFRDIFADYAEKCAHLQDKLDDNDNKA